MSLRLAKLIVLEQQPRQSALQLQLHKQVASPLFLVIAPLAQLISLHIPFVKSLDCTTQLDFRPKTLITMFHPPSYH